MPFPQRLHVTFHQTALQPSPLDRIVSTCRSRGYEITTLQFVAADQHGPGWARLTVSGRPNRPHLLEQKLRAMVETASVTLEEN
jgi:acetolactate synthase small subunit